MKLVMRISVAVAAVLFAVAAATALFVPRHSWFAFSMPVVWASVALLAGGLVLFQGPASRVAAVVTRHPRIAIGGGAVAGTLLTAAHAPLASIDFAWDARHLVTATEASIAGEPPTSRGYYTRYPGSIPLLAQGVLTARVGEVFGLTPLVSLVTAQVIMVGIMLWCVGDAVALLGRPGALLPVQALGTALIGLNGAVAAPYSDIPSAALVALSVWAGVRAFTTGQRWWWALAVLALVPTFSFKPFTIALLAAALPFTLMSRAARPVGRAAISIAVGTVVILGGSALITPTATMVTGRDDPAALDPEEDAYPVWRWVVLGTYDSRDETRPREYGGYSGAPAQVMKDLEPDQWSAALRDAAVQQVTSRSVLENAEFFTNKILWTWGDGTFWAFGEARDREQPPQLDGAGEAMQHWFIGSGSPYRTWTAGMTQAVWIVTLLIAAATCWQRRDHPVVVASAMVLVALTGYLTIFETRPRYLIALLPVLFLLVSMFSMPKREDIRAACTTLLRRRPV